MSEVFSREVECIEKLELLNQNEHIYEKEIICFGNNDVSRCVISYLKKIGVKVKTVIDNRAVEGTYIDDVPIVKPELYVYHKNSIILIGSRFFCEMRYQLTKLGCKEEQVFEVVHYPQIYNPSLSKSTLKKEINYIKKGYRVYKKIRKQIGQNVKLIISPAKSIGDIYLVLAYLGAYLKTQETGYGFVLSTKGAAHVCKEAGENNYVVIHEMNELCRFIQFVGETRTNSFVINPIPMYANRIRNINGYGNCRCFDIPFRNFVADMNHKTIGTPIKAEKIEFNLKKKSVVISPYANFLQPLNEDFWNKLIKKLKENKWDIYTNGVNGKEKELEGTTSISWGFSKTLAFLNEAGFFIGIRSGLCDVLSSTTAKMIVLYPEQKVSNGIDAIEYFNMVNMGLNMYASEIKYQESNEDKIIKTILDEMESSITID